MLVFSPYCYSDTIYGVTNNAVTDSLNWSMTGVLPDHSAPNVSLQINGVTYYYVMTKDEGEDVTVYVRNEDAVNGGYIFEEVDDWSGLPGNSIQKYFRFPGSNATLWGDGEITVDGTGTVSDASVIYMYRMDIGEEEIICTNPLANPQCPGYIEALYKYLASLENLSADDPYYDEWVQLQLKKETQIEDKQAENKTEDDEEDIEKRLQVDPEVGGLIKLDTQNKFIKGLYKTFPWYSCIGVVISLVFLILSVKFYDIN